MSYQFDAESNVSDRHDNLSPEELIRLPVVWERRDVTRFGQVWEVDEIERDKSMPIPRGNR
jgi:hypothetical protein